MKKLTMLFLLAGCATTRTTADRDLEVEAAKQLYLEQSAENVKLMKRLDELEKKLAGGAKAEAATTKRQPKAPPPAPETVAAEPAARSPQLEAPEADDDTKLAPPGLEPEAGTKKSPPSPPPVRRRPAPTGQPLYFEGPPAPPMRPEQQLPLQSWGSIDTWPVGCEKGPFALEIQNQSDYWFEIFIDNVRVDPSGPHDKPAVPPGSSLKICLAFLGDHSVRALAYGKRVSQFHLVGRYDWKGEIATLPALFHPTHHTHDIRDIDIQFVGRR